MQGKDEYEYHLCINDGKYHMSVYDNKQDVEKVFYFICNAIKNKEMFIDINDIALKSSMEEKDEIYIIKISSVSRSIGNLQTIVNNKNNKEKINELINHNMLRCDILEMIDSPEYYYTTDPRNVVCYITKINEDSVCVKYIDNDIISKEDFDCMVKKEKITVVPIIRIPGISYNPEEAYIVKFSLKISI